MFGSNDLIFGPATDILFHQQNCAILLGIRSGWFRQNATFTRDYFGVNYD